MTPSGQAICLCMIVKNEAPVIARCLNSVRPIIDHWVIVDTGSNDGTQELIRAYFADLPGELVERPWVDFGHNRSEALALAQPHGDYTLIIDADDELLLPAGFAMPALDADSYVVDITDAGIAYQRTQLVKNNVAWRYRGVLHEFLSCEDARSVGHAPILMRRNHDGARRRGSWTYRKDAKVLETALLTEADPFMRARYTFYLAQSYRDAGEADKAIEAYERRAKMGFWHQEIYCSMLSAGRIREQNDLPAAIVLATYARAIALCPTRAEAHHAAGRYCRLKGDFERGYAMTKAAVGVEPPRDGLFVETWIYDYGLLDEHAVNAYWAGRYRASLDAGLRALQSGKAPVHEQPRLLENLRFALDKMPADETAAEVSVAHQACVATPAPIVGRAFVEDKPPRILIAILAKQKEPVLSLYLQCIEALDYPKAALVLYVRTNNNKDRTAVILRSWLEGVAKDYAHVEFDESDVETKIESFGVHEWNATRFRILAAIRNTSMRKTLDHGCDFYFVADVDNFLKPSTLRELVSLDLPIVAPMLRHVDRTSRYSNFHAGIDRNGYFVEVPAYEEILTRRTGGVFDVPVVHCTYLVRADQIPFLRYDDDTERHEYVVFSESARLAGIPQYLDNRQDYGRLTLNDDAPDLIAGEVEQIARLLGFSGSSAKPGAAEAEARRAFEAIYAANAWSHGSGPGSLPINTIEYRGFLERFIESNAIKRVTDLGCGDWQSTLQIDWSHTVYRGFDLVESVIASNRARHARSNITFDVFREIDDLPGGDLLIAKEVLQHLPNATIDAYVAHIRRKYKFILLTNSVEPRELANSDIDAGGYRPLRLEEAPFSFAGAKIFTYHSQAGSYIWKNVVFLILGTA